jgi:hypothetical protein
VNTSLIPPASSRLQGTADQTDPAGPALADAEDALEPADGLDGLMVGFLVALVAGAVIVVARPPVVTVAAVLAPVLFVGWLVRWGRDGEVVPPLDFDALADGDPVDGPDAL